jgi:hypothetical protein
VDQAIEWFNSDTSPTRQILEGPEGPRSPGQLLEDARKDAPLDRLLGDTADSRARALVDAQAVWLIRRMPVHDTKRHLDSAQQAGRAWATLIAADTRILPSHAVVNEVARRTDMPAHVAIDIVTKARSTRDAFDRATQLSPYDKAPDQVLIDDWHQLAACGAELPDAAKRAQDVLDLIVARTTGLHNYSWMSAEAQHAAQVYDCVIQAQPLLNDLAALIPHAEQPDAAGQQERLLSLDRSALSEAATAAARALAVQKWAHGGQDAGQTGRRALLAVGPSMRLLSRLNVAILALDPSGGPTAAMDLDTRRLSAIVERLRAISAAVHQADSAPTPPADRRPQQVQQHRYKPRWPGPGPGTGGPRPNM